MKFNYYYRSALFIAKHFVLADMFRNYKMLLKLMVNCSASFEKKVRSKLKYNYISLVCDSSHISQNCVVLSYLHKKKN